jgi:hypothetical protein
MSKACIYYIKNPEAWPNCSIPDCEYKACLSADSDKCYGHTFGTPMVPFEEYIKQEPRA